MTTTKPVAKVCYINFGISKKGNYYVLHKLITESGDEKGNLIKNEFKSFMHQSPVDKDWWVSDEYGDVIRFNAVEKVLEFKGLKIKEFKVFEKSIAFFLDEEEKKRIEEKEKGANAANAAIKNLIDSLGLRVEKEDNSGSNSQVVSSQSSQEPVKSNDLPF